MRKVFIFFLFFNNKLQSLERNMRRSWSARWREKDSTRTFNWWWLCGETEITHLMLVCLCEDMLTSHRSFTFVCACGRVQVLLFTLLLTARYIPQVRRVFTLSLSLFLSHLYIFRLSRWVSARFLSPSHPLALPSAPSSCTFQSRSEVTHSLLASVVCLHISYNLQHLQVITFSTTNNEHRTTINNTVECYDHLESFGSTQWRWWH